MWGKTTGYHAGRQEAGRCRTGLVNLRECTSHTPPPSANKAANFDFKTQRRYHQKSKTGVSVAPQKELMSSNFF